MNIIEASQTENRREAVFLFMEFKKGFARMTILCQQEEVARTMCGGYRTWLVGVGRHNSRFRRGTLRSIDEGIERHPSVGLLPFSSLDKGLPW